MFDFVHGSIVKTDNLSNTDTLTGGARLFKF